MSKPTKCPGCGAPSRFGRLIKCTKCGREGCNDCMAYGTPQLCLECAPSKTNITGVVHSPTISEEVSETLSRISRAHDAILGSLQPDDLSTVKMLRKRARRAPGRNWEPRGWSGVIPCPACGKRLSYDISGYNGHVHAACETEGCVCFME